MRNSDPVKHVQRVYELSLLSNVPLRLLLSKDVRKGAIFVLGLPFHFV